MDKIKVKDLEVFARHGAFPEENVLGQKFLVSVTMYMDTREAGMTDNLTKSIHYGEVSHFIKKFMEENVFKLIETVAEKLARELLIAFPLMEKLDLEIKKPWAPIGLPLEMVSVEISRGWHLAYLGMGSSLGDKKQYLDGAVRALQETEGCEVLKVADYLATEPYGGAAKEEFLNSCMVLRTLFTPRELLERLHEIEQEANRERLVHWGDRTLDLDILMYDDLVMDSAELTIPHVEMHLRSFVLDPLSQIAPYKKHPVLQKTVMQLRSELEND
ncbi:MAG: 2-amino-4-hydroxy-6-hydroxymethyldihydropteridine diphosphokinase [Lachnospiraceae bacterium]|nr:2-amino-4-hydroxy-6-hydroxymethyldihydropteridine diphosphokinase [Robinsoniella sp.]MDY3766550.1 2-amino-4-hydroxy-6-hydroxymethyldihydropteridine diphosphokinase [Lachnospiraceae bacterium]